MSDTKRAWFRFHLSTLVVLSLLVGAFGAANVSYVRSRMAIAFGWLPLQYEESRGWPNQIHSLEIDTGHVDLMLCWEAGNKAKFQFLINASNLNPCCKIKEAWIRRGIFKNLALALVALTAVGFGCEWWVRRRAQEK